MSQNMDIDMENNNAPIEQRMSVVEQNITEMKKMMFSMNTTLQNFVKRELTDSHAIENASKVVGTLYQRDEILNSHIEENEREVAAATADMKNIYEGAKQRFHENETKIDSNNFKTAAIETEVSQVKDEVKNTQRETKNLKHGVQEEVNTIKEMISMHEQVVQEDHQDVAKLRAELMSVQQELEKSKFQHEQETRRAQAAEMRADQILQSFTMFQKDTEIKFNNLEQDNAAALHKLKVELTNSTPVKAEPDYVPPSVDLRIKHLEKQILQNATVKDRDPKPNTVDSFGHFHATATSPADIQANLPTLVYSADDKSIQGCTKSFSEVTLAPSEAMKIKRVGIQDNFSQFFAIQSALIAKQVRYSDWTTFLVMCCSDEAMYICFDHRHQRLPWHECIYLCFQYIDYPSRNRKRLATLQSMSPTPGTKLSDYLISIVDIAKNIKGLNAFPTTFSKIEDAVTATSPFLTRPNPHTITRFHDFYGYISFFIPLDITISKRAFTTTPIPTDNLLALNAQTLSSNNFYCTNCTCYKCTKKTSSEMRPGFCVNCSCTKCKQRPKKFHSSTDRQRSRFGKLNVNEIDLLSDTQESEDDINYDSLAGHSSDTDSRVQPDPIFSNASTASTETDSDPLLRYENLELNEVSARPLYSQL